MCAHFLRTNIRFHPWTLRALGLEQEFDHDRIARAVALLWTQPTTSRRRLGQRMTRRPQQLAVAAVPRTTSRVATARVGAETVFLIWSLFGPSLFGRRWSIVGRRAFCSINTECNFRQYKPSWRKFACNVILSIYVSHNHAPKALSDEPCFRSRFPLPTILAKMY